MELDKIYNANSYEFIKTIPDKSIDLIYTDVPYIVNTGGAGSIKYKYEKLEKDLTNVEDITNGIDYSILNDFCRILKHIYIYIWCSEKQIYDFMNFFQGKNCYINVLVWGKSNPIPLGNLPFLSDLEYCLCIHEKGCKFYQGWEHKSKLFVSPINNKDKDLYNHPTIKPLEMVKNHIINSTKENDIVADFFLGSGTTAVACKELNRHYIGCELNPEYYQIAVDRLNGITQKYKSQDQREKEQGILNIYDFLGEE